MELSEQLKNIRTGHILLVLCCLIYLVWWSITFNPMKTFPALPKYVLFIGIAVTGITGAAFLIRTFVSLPAIRATISNTVILVSGVCMYAALLNLTARFLHRQVTTELLLIVGWTALELCALSSIYGANAVSFSYTVFMAVIIVAAAAVSLICYLLYYNLKPVTGFYDGMVPLILFGVVMAVQALLVRIP